MAVMLIFMSSMAYSPFSTRYQPLSPQAVWVVLVLIWRYISLASIGGSIAFPVTLAITIAMIPAWTFASLWPLLIAAIVIPILVIVLHRGNIKRLRAGTEGKIRSKRTS